MEITVDYLKDKVHEQYLELQELRKSYDELTKSALQLNEIVKEKQKRIDKAIEIINKALQPKSDYVDYDFGTELLRQELLEILKGEDKK